MSHSTQSRAPRQPDVSPSPVEAEQVRRFREDGFVLVPDLLTREEIARYGAAVDAGVADRVRFDKRSLDQKTRYEQSFQQCINLWEDREDVRPLSFHERIGEAAARLLEVEAVRIWHDQALYKEAGGLPTLPHQDQPYWAIHEPLTITAWIPFDDVGETNGQLGYLPGTHTSGLRKFANIFTADGLDLEAHEETAGADIRFLDVPAGAVAFHHGLTVHLSYPNRSDVPRRIHTIIFFADGCTRNERSHPSVDRSGIEPGRKIEGPLTPIVWPRDTNALPTPPSSPDPPIPGWPGWEPSPENLARLAQSYAKVDLAELE